MGKTILNACIGNVLYEYCWGEHPMNTAGVNIRFNIALANQNSIIKMASLGRHLGDSMTSLLNVDQKKETIDALSFSWDKWMSISKIKRIDFIKIDIEGGEFALLPTMKNYLLEYKPIVYLSIHAPLIDNGIKKEQMQRIVEAVKVYNTCLDENMETVPIDKLYSEDSMSNIRSFVLLNSKNKLSFTING